MEIGLIAACRHVKSDAFNAQDNVFHGIFGKGQFCVAHIGIDDYQLPFTNREMLRFHQKKTVSAQDVKQFHAIVGMGQAVPVVFIPAVRDVEQTMPLIGVLQGKVETQGTQATSASFPETDNLIYIAYVARSGLYDHSEIIVTILTVSRKPVKKNVKSDMFFCGSSVRAHRDFVENDCYNLNLPGSILDRITEIPQEI